MNFGNLSTASSPDKVPKIGLNFQNIISPIKSQDDNLTFWSNGGIKRRFSIRYANDDSKDAQILVPQQEREEKTKKKKISQ